MPASLLIYYNLVLNRTQISTVICTSLLRDTIEYYNENGSDCYLLLLVVSKAFDRVVYVRLCRPLRDRNMCPTVLRFLMNMSVNQLFQVKWNNISSQSHISNGVKQGGWLSPGLESSTVDQVLKYTKYHKYIPSVFVQKSRWPYSMQSKFGMNKIQVS